MTMRFLALPLSLLPLGLSLTSVSANPLTATVSTITDGDTLTLNQNGQQIVVQLACIDAPDWRNGQAEYGAQDSKNLLSQLIPIGSSVQYYNRGSAGGNRVLAVIFYRSMNINLQMITEGQAKLHPNYTGKCPSSANDLYNAQVNAQNSRLGIWNR